jgi:DNA-binding NarL/FixJ family response regulator
MPTNPITSAAHCGRYDCGHILRSDDRALKRAAFLHLSREAGLTVSTSGEAADVLAALALMRDGRPCSEVREYRTPGVSAATRPTTPATVSEVVVSEQVVEVYRLLVQGYDIPEIAEATYRATETVRSLLAVGRKRTGAHSSMAAGVALTRLGLL